MKTIYIAIITSTFFLFGFTNSPIYEYEYIEFIDGSYKPIIKVSLNGKRAYFLVDSGSDITVLDYSQIKKYEFSAFRKNNENHFISGLVGNTNAVMSTKEVNLQIGSSRVFTRFLSVNIKQLVCTIQRNTGIHISGIIGSDLMMRYGFIIDYGNNQIGMLKRESKSGKAIRKPVSEPQENYVF